MSQCSGELPGLKVASQIKSYLGNTNNNELCSIYSQISSFAFSIIPPCKPHKLNHSCFSPLHLGIKLDWKNQLFHYQILGLLIYHVVLRKLRNCTVSNEHRNTYGCRYVCRVNFGFHLNEGPTHSLIAILAMQWMTSSLILFGDCHLLTLNPRLETL